jgi:hypothetical protein
MKEELQPWELGSNKKQRLQRLAVTKSEGKKFEEKQQLKVLKKSDDAKGGFLCMWLIFG